ncbi:sarcalumenin [Gemella bergeri]
MKNNNLLKILWGMVFVIFLSSALFLGYNYFFGKSSTKEKDKTSQTNTTKKVEKEEKQNSNTTDSTQSSTENKTKNQDQKNSYEYDGKKLSHSAGLGNTGKVFNSQKEAMEYGNQEIARLIEKDKKPRQFSISRVTSEDGKLVGWTVDIFESNNG